MITIFIPGVPRNANAGGQQKFNRWDKAKFRAKAKKLAEEAVLPDGWPPEFIRITAKQISPVRRRRDPTGLAERLKGILDGLVDGGLLIDDDEDHIEVLLAHSEKGTAAGIMLTLEPACNPSKIASSSD